MRTVPQAGPLRETHVWFVEREGELWLEAGTPENPWFLDVRTNPELEFSASDRPAQKFIALPLDTKEASRRIRALLREKYGWRDWWIGLLVEAEHSVAVRLEPVR